MRRLNQGCGELQMVHQQTTQGFYHNNKMLIANTCELDQLPFLKKPHYNWVPDQQQGQKTKIKLLQNLRTISYQSSTIMAKIFTFNATIKSLHNPHENQQQQPQLPFSIQELIVTTEKQICTLQTFFYLLDQVLQHSQFSKTVNSINAFIHKTQDYIRNLVAKYQIYFKNKQFLTFGIYLQKSTPNSLDLKKQKPQLVLQQFISKNQFYIKCAFSNFNFKPTMDFSQIKTKKPQPFAIKNELIISRLFNLYLELAPVSLPIKPKDVKQYIDSHDRYIHIYDQEYLSFQVLKNFPLLRSKFYLPVIFNDRFTNQRLDGPIFSNSDPDCMFGHFIGYNADRIKDLEGNHCGECRSYIEGVQQNPIMTRLRDNPYNPYKADVLFCPQFNRFKLIIKTPIPKSEEEEEEIHQHPKFKTQIKYLNYLHFRSNLRKISTKKRNKFNDMCENERFSLTFSLWGRKSLIMDPARGKNCSHYEFTDLRSYYLNKISQNTFKCPICKDTMSDNDILYLRQVQILLKYLKFKCANFKDLVTTGYCFIDHQQEKVFLDFKKRNKENKDIIEKQIIEIKGFYDHLIDPYVPFNHYTLGIPDKYQKKVRQMYLFPNEKQNQGKDSDDDFEFKDTFSVESNLSSSKSLYMSQSSVE